MPTYKFIDLFAGLGGFHLALEQLGCKCVFASELQQDLRTLYESNFGMKCAGDINLINIEKDIPSHDILCGGFPCQPFSQAEKRGRSCRFRGIAKHLRTNKEMPTHNAGIYHCFLSPL